MTKLRTADNSVCKRATKGGVAQSYERAACRCPRRLACLVTLTCRCRPPGCTGAVAAPCKPAGAAPVSGPCQCPRLRAARRGNQRAWRVPGQAEVLFIKDKQGAPMEAMLRVLDGKLAGRTFLVGEAVSAADVALASHLLFFRVFVPQVRQPGPRLPHAPLQRAAPACHWPFTWARYMGALLHMPSGSCSRKFHCLVCAHAP